MDLILVFLSVVFVLILYRLITSRGGDLETSGIVHDKSLPIIGNIWTILSGKEGIIHYLERNYWKFRNEKIYSFYQLMGQPSVVPCDPAFIKQIMIRDFDYFTDRQYTPHDFEFDRLLSKSVLFLPGQKWRDMRTMLSPIYTSSKMKYMYGLLVECMEDFIKVYEKKTEANGGELEIETHDVFARITADGIATTALGFKGDCVVNENSEIYKVADDMEADFTNPTSLTLMHMFPLLFKLTGRQFFRKSVHDFFLTNVTNEIKRRREGNITRPDVIQLLIQAKEGQLKLEAGDAEEISYIETKIRKIANWTDEDLVAQAFVLFGGGFETTATLMQTLSFELARNEDIQQKLIKEVDEMLEVLNGKTINYDQLNQMKYLDMVVQETLRKWPSFRVTSRICTKDYLLKDDESGKEFKIKKGSSIFIPIAALQWDPKYFPDPEKFDPSRFSDENKHKIVSGSFSPFGVGPRMCIGSRYALLEAKLLAFYVISKFTFKKTSRTPETLTITKGTSGYNEKIYVTLKSRK